MLREKIWKDVKLKGIYVPISSPDIICESQKKNSVLIWCSCLTDLKIFLLQKQSAPLWGSGQTKSILWHDQPLTKIWRTYSLCLPSSLVASQQGKLWFLPSVVTFSLSQRASPGWRPSDMLLLPPSIALSSLQCMFVLLELDNV